MIFTPVPPGFIRTYWVHGVNGRYSVEGAALEEVALGKRSVEDINPDVLRDILNDWLRKTPHDAQAIEQPDNVVDLNSFRR